MRQDSQPGNSEFNPSGQGCRAGAWLQISRGQVSQRERAIEVPVFTMGSGADCDLILGDDQFPELYAYILRTHEGYRLRCLSAEPILTVNAEDTVAAWLETGDRIRCGPYEFHFQKLAGSSTQSPELPKSEVSPMAMRWVAHDGQRTDGIGSVQQLLRDIRMQVDDQPINKTLRRSA